MIDTKLTRQGIRDLGGNTRPQRQCPRSSTGRHHPGPLITVGREYRFDVLYGDYYIADIDGHRCMWCGKVL